MKRKRLCEAIASYLTSLLTDATVHVVSSGVALFECSHRDSADLTPLGDLGIQLPDKGLAGYYQERHYVRGVSSFPFFVTNKIFNNIQNKIKGL